MTSGHVPVSLNEKTNSWQGLLALLIFCTMSFCGQGIFAQTASQTFNSGGTFVVPAGVTSVTVEAWGGGGRGANRTTNGAGAGGGGGAYAKKVVTVNPGQSYSVTVGPGGSVNTAGTNGGDSWFISPSTVMAKGGANVETNFNTAGAGGSAAASVGDVTFSGGNGATGSSGLGGNGGGGGSSAGPAANGGNGSGVSGGTAPSGGGTGGSGALVGGAPAPGATLGASVPGGGGGGGLRFSFISATTWAPANGAAGRVTITWATPPPVITAAPMPQTLAVGGTISLSVTASLANSYQWKKNGVNIGGATSATYTKANATAADAGYYSVSVTNDFATVNSTGAVVIVNPYPTATASVSASPVCDGSPINLTTGGNLNSTASVTIINENFNSAANAWFSVNSSTGGTPANAAWTLRPNAYLYSATSTTFNSNDASQFYLSNSDAQGSGGTTSTVLQSPAFSTMGMNAASLSYYHYYRHNGDSAIRVEASTNGSSWTTLTTTASTQGAPGGFVQATVALGSFLNQPRVYVRFRYTGTFDYFWAIDNVVVTGTLSASPAYAWSSTPAGFNSSAQNPSGVVPVGNTNYTVMVTNHYGLSATSSPVSVTVNPNITYYADADGDSFGDNASPQVSCFGAPAGYVLNNTDCDDADESLNATYPFYVDADDDGFGAGTLVSICAIDAETPPVGFSVDGTDCNDADADIHMTFPFYADADGDGFGAGIVVQICAADGETAPAGYSVNNTDCNDSNMEMFTTFEFYADADGDGFGTGELVSVCAVDAATPPAGYSLNATDCDDAIAAVNPAHSEVLYNGIDDNCDGELDEGFQHVTQVQAAQCGTTLVNINSLIAAISKNNSTGYRFEVTNTATNEVQVIDRPLHYFSLNMLASYDYATTYSVRVMIQRLGIWLGYYGPACFVSSPAVLDPGGAAQIAASQCGITLPTINTLIATNSIQNCTGYRFRVTNITDPNAPNQVQTVDRPLHWFGLTMLPTFNYGTTYMIEVAVKTNGEFSGFGAPCMVTSRPVPSLVNCGVSIPTAGTLVATTSYERVTSYRFEVTNLITNTVTTIDRPLHWFKFNMVPGYIPGDPYGVRVALMTSGSYSPYGDACEIFAPGGSRQADPELELSKAVFSATAYPNPFTETFAVAMEGNSGEKVQVKMYDMTGRLLESLSEDSESGLRNLGASLPAGVYNIIISQGENIRSMRVVKR
jgi:hypothetical protein